AFVTPMYPAVGCQLAQQLRRKLKHLVGEEMLLQEFEGLTLSGRLDGHKRIAAIRVAPVIAVHVFAADETGDQVRRIAVLPRQHGKRLTDALITLTFIDYPI